MLCINHISSALSFRETAPEQYFFKTIKDIGDCIWKTSTNKSESVPTTDKHTDLKLMCNDGVIYCHQAILASHSFFIRSMLLRNHVLEFGSNIDWIEASAYLCDRRKPEHDATIILNDFDCDTISRMLSCFYTGKIFEEYFVITLYLLIIRISIYCSKFAR